jgi:uncharacterized protein DUF6640
MSKSSPTALLARNGGRLLLTGAGIATIVAPVLADWNPSHVFNDRWPSHARFHGAASLGMAVGLAGFGLWRLWAPSADRAAGRDLAAAIPIAYWGPFFPAALVRGTGVDDEPYPVGRVAGVPANLFGAALTSAMAVAGWLLDRHAGR